MLYISLSAVFIKEVNNIKPTHYMSEPYTPPSAYTSDTTSCHDSDEPEEFFLEDQLPTKSRIQVTLVIPVG